MFITNIDNYLDNLIDKFYKYTNDKNIFNKFSKDENFVKYQNDIINIVKTFVEDLDKDEIKKLLPSKNNLNYILNVIKRYCMFYIYLGISYYYKSNRDLFITNIIETSKNQKDIEYQIDNFYNTENNSKIISFYTIIKHFLELREFKTIDRIKITLVNNPIKYDDTIKVINVLGEDYMEKYIFISDNFHNILKTFIFKIIYLNEEKIEITKILNETEDKNAEYKYIEIVEATDEKLIDFTVLQDFISMDEDIIGKTEDFYDFLLDYKNEEQFNVTSTKKILDFLFSNRILIPITEDFMRFHKNNYKYDVGDDKTRYDTKIKFILNIVNKVKNYYSNTYKVNPKLKLAVKDLFYKQLSERDAILYNSFEENNIINKLKDTHTSEADYVIDLENIKKYTYLNYKDLSKDGFKLRTTKPVQGFRYSSVKKNTNLELRIGHSDLPMNVVGVIFNPSNRSLECFNKKNLRDIHKINKNGFDGFMKILKDKFDSKENNIYFWLFDKENDIMKLDEYKNVSTSDTERYVQLLLSEIYPTYLSLLNKKIINEIKLNNPDLFTIKNIIRKYNNNLYKSDLNINFSKNILSKVIDLFYEEVDIDVESIDIKLLENQQKSIKLPVIKKLKKTDDITYIKKEDKKIDLDEIKNQPICHHYVKWNNLSKIPKKYADELNQAVFDFVKQYVRVNEVGLYICKSCSESLNLKKYVYEGTYVPELDTFLTTNLATNQKLENIPKYSKYTRTIRNIEKNIEKICGLLNINYYIGNTPVIKLRRRTIIKDMIDLILIHTKYLRTQPKNRIEQASINYGINKNLTNLFFFDLKDEIFLTSADDTDYYKIIKFNNIIAYLVFIIISELNTGQIISFKDDKRCNYILYDKVKNMLFENLYFRVSKDEKIPVLKIDGLCYTLFYFSCMLTNNNIWLWNYNKKENNVFVVQKIFINTLVDLINTLFEANLKDNKNYLYELIVNRFKQKLKSVYNDDNLIKVIKKDAQSNIKIKDGKLTYLTKKEKIYNLNEINDDNFYIQKYEDCKTTTRILNILPKIYRTNDYNILTNCDDGKFHRFSFNKNKKDLVCEYCNKNYNDILKELGSDNNLDKEKVKLLKLIYLKNLGEKYCISGEIHNPDENNICTKCKLDLNNPKYKNDDLYKLEKNLNNVSEEEFIIQFNKVKKFFRNKEKKVNEINDIITQMNNRYNNKTKNKIVNYIDDFIELLKNKVGDKISIMNKVFYLNKTTYILTNDLYGNKLKSNINLIGNNNVKMFFDKFLNKDVISIKDNVNNAFLLFDNITKRYLGYKKNNKYELLNVSNNLVIEYSLRDMIINLGLSNNNFNVNYTDYNTNTMSKEEIYSNKNYLVNDIIRFRVLNLRQIINNINSIIDEIKYNKKSNANISKREVIINDLKKNIDNIQINSTDGSKKIFKHLNIINNNLNIEKLDNDINFEINNNYINLDFLQNLNNLDQKLIFYLLFNLDRLLEYNNKTNIVIMVIKLLHYSFNQYFIPYENLQIRKFDSLILKDRPYIDESLRVIGFYQELVDLNSIDEEKTNDMILEAEEEVNSYDIDMDGYDEDDNNLDFDADENVVQDIMD